MAAQRSIVICGGAFAGLALALALRQGLGPDIPVVVADPALAARPSRDPRATAIVAACRRLFEVLGVWGQIAADSQAILDMVVTDSRLEDATRPVFLTFAGNVEPGEPFAHMVENRRLIDALVARAEAEGVDLRATAVSTYDSRPDGVTVTLADGNAIEASLLVAADGARPGTAGRGFRRRSSPCRLSVADPGRRPGCAGAPGAVCDIAARHAGARTDAPQESLGEGRVDRPGGAR